MNKMLALFIVIGLVMISAGASFADDVEDQGEPSGEPPVCTLPSTAATITVKQEADSPVYEYFVTNNHSRPIFMIVFGASAETDEGLNAFYKELIPVQYVYPEGWTGETGGESETIVYGFSVDLNHTRHGERTIEERAALEKRMIQPGETLSGFKLIMVKPLQLLEELPFMVEFTDFKCMYGNVVRGK